jgi:hypothetical protein
MRINDSNSMNAASSTQTAPQYRTGGPGMEEQLF